MPADYLAVRDSCIARKKKKNGGKISKKGISDCKTMASIWYWKKHGKTVNSAHASKDVIENMKVLTQDIKELGIDLIDLDILSEQLDLFGNLTDYEQWQEETTHYAT